MGIASSSANCGVQIFVLPIRTGKSRYGLVATKLKTSPHQASSSAHPMDYMERQRHPMSYSTCRPNLTTLQESIIEARQ